MSRINLVIIVLMVILTTSFLIFIMSNTPYTYKPGIWNEADKAVNQAQHLYNLEKDRGTNFSLGPCLSNSLQSGWVLDIVHIPRQPVDELSENQCQAYIQGQAKHFVELDTEGNLVRVK